MNRIYQVIWSSVKDCYVVVSENAGRHGKKKAVHLAPSTTKRTMLAMSLGAAVLMASGAAAEAAPTGENATISGGVNGDASGKYSSISGGGDNEAIGEAASVSGGSQGKATGTRASVTGGFQNQAAGECATVNGGSGNKAFGWGSSIIGGTGNVVGKMAVDENGNPKLKDSKGNDVVATIKTDGKGNTYLVDSKGHVIKDANPYTDSNSFAGSVAVAIGGMSSSVQGNYSVGIAGGSTSEAAEHGLAAGRKATVTMANGVAIGYESTASVINSSRAADKEGRIVSFGHQKGDVYYDVDYQNHIVTEHKYDSAAYNRLVNVADGIDDHDVVVMEQLKVLASQGMNFQGNDTSNSVHLDQGGTLQIQGSGRKNDTEYSTQNVKVLTDTANKRLSIALDKNPTFDSVTAGTENSTSGGGQAGSIKIVGANSSSANKATTITAGYAASPELSGTRGTGRISYTDGDGTAHTVAILGDGLKLAGDTGTGSVALDKTLTVSGGAANLADGNNIGVTANESTLLLKLAKDITGLDTVTAGGVKMGTQSDGNDTTKSGKYVTGLDNTAWTVGQTQPVTGRAATEDQLKSVSDEVNNKKTQITTNTENIAKGLNFSASNKVDGTYKTVKKNLGDTVAVRASDAKDDHTYKTDNLTTEIDDNGIITVKMDTQLTADKVTVGTGDNAITIDGSNGSLKTGSSTLNGTGLTINNGPSVTTSGISGGNQKMTNVASGKSGDDASGNPVYETVTNAAIIGDVKNIVAKTVTVSGDDKNTKVDKTTKADGTVDYKVSLNDSVTLGSDAGKKIALDGTAGTVSVGDKITLNGNAGTAAIGGATLGNDGADTYLTGLTNKTWDGTAVSGRAATEDQLNEVAKTIKGEASASDIYVESGSVSYGNNGEGTGTLVRKNDKTTGQLTGLHDYYVTGGSVSTDGKNLNLTKNGGDAIPGIDMTNVLNQDSHLVAADSGEYTVGSDGRVTLKVKNNAAGSTPTDVVISGIASNAALQKGLNFEANGAEKEGGSAAYNAQLGNKISVLGGAAKDKHTYNTDNITTTMDNGTITVKLDNDLTANSLTAGSSTVDGTVRVTGAKGAYVEMDGSDGSIHLGNNGGRYSALYQNYGGKGFLTAETSPRLEYAVDNDPNTRHTIATLDDGMKFAGDDAKADSSKTVSTTLNSTLKITGGAAIGNLTDNNIGVVKNGDDGLAVKLNKDLTDMGTISFAPTAGTAGSGIKIGSQTIANNGTSPNDAAGDYITGLTNTKWSKDGIVSGRAATEDQLQQVANAIVNGSATGGGFGLSADNADSKNATEVKQDLGSTIKITTDGDTNLTTTADSAKKAIVVSLNKDLNLNKATFTDGTSGATTIVDGNGIVVTPKQGSDADKVKLTTDGLSNGGKQITNVQSGLTGMTIENAAGDVLNHGATIGDLQTVSNGVKTELTNKGLDFKGNGNTTVHRNLGETLTIQGTGADGRDYDGGANVQVKADANTLTVQLDRDLNAHTLTLGKASTGTETGEAGTLILNGKNKDKGMSPVFIGVTYRGNQNNEAMKTAMSRITYKGGNGNDHTVATLEDGLQLSGDNGEALNTTLDKKATIKGGVAKDELVDNTTDPTKNNNIGVVASQDAYGNTTLSLQLAKDIAGLNTVTAGSVVMGNQNVISVGKVSGQGNFVTGLDNKTWDGKDYVSGRAATEDQLKTVSDSIKTSVNNAQFGITAGGLADGGDVTVKKNLGESIRIYGDAPVTNEKNDGSGDFWDCSKANILTKVKKDHDGNDYVSVELQDHLEVGVHAGTDTDDKAVEGTDGSMQFKGKSTKEVNITGDTGVILSDGDGQARTQTAALRQNDGTGYLDLAGSKGAFTSLFTKQGKQNLSQEDAKKSDTRLTYTDNSSKTEHQVATMDDGLVIAGDNGQVTRLLNSTLKLSGGADTTKLSDGKNIGVVANSSGDGLDIKLAKDLTDIDSINMTGGLKLNSSNGSSTITGLTNTSVNLPDFGKAGRAATEEQLQQVKDGITNAKQGGGFDLTADGDDQVNSPKAKADLGGTIGIHGDSNITTSVSDDGKSINIKLKKDVDLGNDGSIKAGGVTIDNKGIDAGGKNITNVKSGVVKGDDSDNGNAANIGDVKHIVDGKLGDVNGKIDNITKDVSTIKQTKRTYQGDDGKVVNVDFGGALSLTGGATEVAEDKNIGVVKNGENGLSLRLAKKLNGLESVTTGKTTMDDNGLTIMNGDNKPGTAVTGSGIKIASGGEGTHAVELTNSNVSMGGQQVHGVADGTSDDDAVNVSQLKKSVGAIGGAIDKVDRRVDRVGAGAAALAALHPQDFDPDDKWDFAVGYGNYRGANAAAVGAFYKPNEDTTFSVGGTVGGGENMVNAGISFKFGQGNHVSNSRVAMAKEIKDLRKEVEDLRSALVDVAAGKQLDPAKTKLLPDMPKNHWAYKEISELAGNGLLDGDPDGEFKGDRMMTRYEFASIVYRQMMAGRELSDRLVQEFEPELERIRIDVVARHKDGTSSIERVRVNKPADKNSK